LSQSTKSVPAFQVLTIGSFGEANLETSIRSFMRHVTGIPNESLQDPEKEKKRKRVNGHNTSDKLSELSVADATVERVVSPVKRVRGDSVVGDQEKRLPKSIESLYESIMRAQEELEVGRSWSVDEDM
jgi:hypothetical protein